MCVDFVGCVIGLYPLATETGGKTDCKVVCLVMWLSQFSYIIIELSAHFQAFILTLFSTSTIYKPPEASDLAELDDAQQSPSFQL